MSQPSRVEQPFRSANGYLMFAIGLLALVSGGFLLSRGGVLPGAVLLVGGFFMVESALQGLSEREIVVLDDERKAAMVSNLLVVLCSDKDTQPILNAGTLYN